MRLKKRFKFNSHKYFTAHSAALALFITFLLLPAALPASAEQPKITQEEQASEDKDTDKALCLVKGKNSLDKGDFERAVVLLTASYEKLPILGDYALLWRARAFEGKGDTDKALEDLRTIREKYKESPLLKKARLKEVELLKKKNDPAVIKLYEGLVRDEPSNMDMKYAYAVYLKEHNEPQKAQDLFKEVYLSSSNRLASDALGELSPADITADDLVKKGKNLNSAWLFEESEKSFREALRKDKDNSRDDILDGLAYSLFGQKRYKEAAELYKQIGNIYWRARSIFRAGDMDTLQAELPELCKTSDKRVANVLLAYGMKKRRDGDSEGALKIFTTTLSRYPSVKEEALWSIGWTYYLSRDYKNALKTFSQLYTTFGDSKYLYWNNKCKKMLGEPETVKISLNKKNGQDFYAFLSFIKDNQKPPAVEKHPLKISPASHYSERIGILARLGLKQEAASELLHLSRKNPSPNELVSISSYLRELGNYKMSMNIISRMPYSEELHDLFYPLSYWQEVEEASKRRGIDPYLVLSVMREESRFAPDARSIAGAMGLMQLMPRTARRFKGDAKPDFKQASDLYDARTNILIGSYYLKHLLNKLGSIPLALAAYNGGEDAVNDWFKRGNYATIDEFIEDIPYDETRNYVKRVMTTYFEYMRTNGNPDISSDRKYIGGL